MNTRILSNVAEAQSAEADPMSETENPVPMKQTPETERVETADSRCDRCGCSLAPGDKFCNQCRLPGGEACSSKPPGMIEGEKRCPFCKEAIRLDAVKCKHCGEFLDSQMRAARVAENRQKPNGGIAALLSLIIPGAGQMYRGKVGVGLAWLVCTVIGYCLLIVPGLILHFCCIAMAASE